MSKLITARLMLVGLASVLSIPAVTLAQGTASSPAPAPLQMSSLDSATKADPFPPVNPKYFTATTPTAATVDSFLKSLWGYDPNRIWRVEAIEATPAPGVSKVIVFVSDRSSECEGADDCVLCDAGWESCADGRCCGSVWRDIRLRRRGR